MNDVYSNLVNQYGSGNVSATSNGTYEVSYGGAKIIVPQNLSKDAYVVSYTPGSGDTSATSNNRNKINELFTANQMDNAVLVIASSSSGGGKGYSEMGYEMLNSLGCNVKGAITTGFSASAPSSISEAERFSKNHTDIPTMCISIDGTTSTSHLYHGTASDAYYGVNPTSTGGNFSIVTVDGSFDHLNQTVRFANSGITSYNLSTTTENYTDNGVYNCHEGASADVMQFIVPYILGKKDSVNSKKNYYLRDGNRNTIDMSFLRTSFNGNISSNSSKNNNNNTTNDNKATTLSNEEETVEENTYQSAIDKRNKLASLSDLKIINMNSASSNYISSDLQYVCDSMNKIRSVIKSSDSYANIKQMNTQISDGIFGIISSYVNYYMNVVSNLYNKLSLETEAIVSYAQYIVDVDNSLKNKDLGKIGGVPAQPVAPVPLYDDGRNSGKDNTEDDVLKYIFNDGHKMLVSTDGDKIVKITYQYEINDLSKYDEFVKKIYASFENPDIIESVSLNGNIINVILKDSYCATLTLDDVNNMAKEAL